MRCLSQRLKRSDGQKLSSYIKTVIALGILIVVLWIPGFFPKFCDWYADNIYPKLCDGITFLTAWIPVAIGELIMFLGGAGVFDAIIIGILLIFLRKKSGFRSFAAAYFKTCLIALLVIVLIYMPTWYIPFNGTVLGMGNPELRTEYSFEEIEELLQDIVEKGNEAAQEIAVTDDGSVAFNSPEDIHEKVVQDMAGLGGEYSRLSGTYPKVKIAICSDILDRMNIGGYNYPFTMEPTRNKYINPLYLAILEAHELAHHKGYYKENEANFLSQLALSRSTDPYLRLAAYMNMYSYVYADYAKAYEKEYGRPLDIDKDQYPKFDERIDIINQAAIDEEQAIYDADSHIIDNFPALDRLIHNTADKGWEVQDDILEENSYDGVVLLLLQYYYGELDK